MTTPVWMLLGFAAWTLLLLVFTVGTYRWALILTARGQLAGFPSDRVEGADWYRRAMRAHANCIENLPVFGAVVFALHVSGTGGPIVDALAMGALAARVVQSSIHVGLVQTNAVVGVRFTFYCVQAASFLALMGMVARAAAG
jgi:uncharacterized MAPEG superfamily protein